MTSGTVLQEPLTLTRTEQSRRQRRDQKVQWSDVVKAALLQLFSLYALYLIASRAAQLSTAVISLVTGTVGLLGVTAGCHRLWSHRSYKARTPLRFFLMLMHSSSFQGNLHEWCLDHRVHHKFTDTDADPHNSTRGFFYSHVGWLLVTRHPEFVTKSKSVDCSDILADPVVKFQIKHYYKLAFLMCGVIPTSIPVALLGETWWNSFFVGCVLRFCLCLHVTWLVNSAAHMWGSRPYDHHIEPRNNRFVAMTSLGEGFHNYHHVFPWDYSTSEFGIRLNLTTAFLHVMVLVGQAYDLKSPSPEMIKDRKSRTGNHVQDGGY